MGRATRSRSGAQRTGRKPTGIGEGAQGKRLISSSRRLIFKVQPVKATVSTFRPKVFFVCCGSSLHVVQALATGNTVLAISINAQLIEELVAAGAPVIATNIMPDAASLAACRKLAGIAFEQCDPEFARVLRKDLAKPGRPNHSIRYRQLCTLAICDGKNRFVSIRTAAGGNAKLLIESGS